MIRSSRDTELSQSWIFLGLFAFLSLPVFLLWIYHCKNFMVDDSFIFFRYAENVIHGNGFVFNVGEQPGEGFTSWAWLIVLMMFELIGVDLIIFARLTGLILGILSLIILFLMICTLYRESPYRYITAIMVCVPLSLNLSFIAHCVSGMETSLFFLSIVLHLFLTITLCESQMHNINRQWMKYCLTIVFLILARPEGGVLVFFSLITLVMVNNKIVFSKFRLVIFFVFLIAPFALFLLWKWVYFGAIFPLSFFHKIITDSSKFLNSFKHLHRFFMEYWWLHLVSLICIFYRGTNLKGKIHVYFVLSWLSIPSIYIFFMPHMDYLNRFYFPSVIIMLVLCTPVIESLNRKIFTLNHGIVKVIFTILLFIILVVGQNIYYSMNKRVIDYWTKTVSLNQPKVILAKSLSTLPEETCLALTDMGVIPYYSKLTCIDMFGLTDPVINKTGLKIDYLLHRHVDLIMYNHPVHNVPDNKIRSRFSAFSPVFLSSEFKQEFNYLGSYDILPNGRMLYYCYLNSNSPRLKVIQEWAFENLNYE